MRSASSPPTVGSTTISNSVVITSMPVSIARLAMPRSARGTMLPKLRLQRDPSPAGFAHHASATGNLTMPLDALSTAIKIRKVNWVLDADIQNFFGSVSREWLARFLEHRIGDKRINRLIQKWLRAGVLEDGVVTVSDRGTGQGSVISPLLANIYLHYCFDLWAERWRRQEATGDMIIVRYADDIVVGFEHESDARRFWDAMRQRLEEFSLALHPDKTRLIEFGRHV